MKNTGMTATERRAAVSLAFIYSTRMLGLFMILPVFALYARDLEGSTPLLVGLAIGIYGLAQAILQVPFGIASDRYGRKPVIVFGLAIFAAGSIVAAMSDSIYGVILGRVLQGGGAIAAVVMALAADLTQEEHRLKVMAVIGASIGLSFSFALVAGPFLGHHIGVDGIFWVTALLAVVAGLILYLWVPQPVASRFHRDAQPVPALFAAMFRDGQLLRLNFGVFALHMILTATFVAAPLALRDGAGLPAADHWEVYLGVTVAAIVAMVPFIILAEKRRRMKQVFVGAVIALMLSEFALYVSVHSLLGMVLSLLLFFFAFNLLEASLPSLVAKMSPPDKKGTAMGIYTTGQFVGAFIGGVTGGWLYGKSGVNGVFLFCALVAACWVLVAGTMRSPRYLASHMIRVGKVDEMQARHLAAQLTQVRGVAEAVVVPEDGVAYLKVDSHALDSEALARFSFAPAEEESGRATTGSKLLV